MKQIPFETYAQSVPRILNLAGAKGLLASENQILVKPNLVNDSPFPVTTAPECCRQVVLWLKTHTRAQIIIAEGCGDADLSTLEVFRRLGYDTLARELGVQLIDLNQAPLERLEMAGNSIFPHLYLPRVAKESLVFSLPVLKAHSLSRITGTLKNMMGFAPPEHYSGGGFWKKAAFHRQIQASIQALNRYLLPGFTLMDASVGLAEYHLGGPCCDPPAGCLLAGSDPFRVDQAAARLLGLDPATIAHIQPF